MKLSGRIVGKIALIWLCVAFGLLLIVPWLGWTWHLIHGSTIESSGVLFRVPPRYLARGSSDGRASMWRCEVGVPLWRAPYGFLGIYPHRDRPKIDMKLDLNRLQTILVNQGKLEGMSLDAQRKLQTEAGPAVCFQFKSGRRSSASCFFDNSTLSIQYEGSEKFTGDIYELVNSARWQGAGPPFSRE